MKALPVAVWGGRFVAVPTEVGKMTFDVRDMGTTQLMLCGRATHEDEESAVLRRMSGKIRTIIDVGANVGWYPRLISQNNPDLKRVISIEPNPATFRLLFENCQADPRLELLEVAIGAEEKTISFWAAAESNLSSASRRVGLEITVRQTTLDKICADRDLVGAIDFVKCDVEGGEYAVLKGARMIRDVPRPPIWMLEIEDSFLAATNVNINALNEELFRFGGGQLFIAESGGGLKRMPALSGKRSRSNIFFVPEVRIPEMAFLT